MPLRLRLRELSRALAIFAVLGAGMSVSAAHGRRHQPRQSGQHTGLATILTPSGSVGPRAPNPAFMKC
jgi:hypothetical protein